MVKLMLKAAPCLIRPILIASALFCLPIITAAQSSKGCPLSFAEYANSGYKVKEIKVDTPLKIFGQLKSKVAEIKADLAQPRNYNNTPAQGHPLEEKGVLNVASMSVGADVVRKHFSDDLLMTGRVKFTFVHPHLLACQEKDTSLGNPQGEPTLVVEYKVYTSDFLSYLSSIYEGQGQGLSRAVLPISITKFLSSNSPQPYVGFNRSRGIFGGSRLVSKSDNPLFNQINIDASGSSSSAQASLNLQGSKDFNSKALGHAEWLVAYSYSDIPSAPMTLKEGRGAAQFIGATQPLGKLKFVLRYGAAMEGGNKQTDIAPSLVPHGILTSTGYGSLKLFAGGTFRKGWHDFTASYGFEVGETESDRRVDYIKHIFDLGYSRRFLLRPHKPITLDTRFTAGDLDTRGLIPLGVRFFGGNAEQNFLSGDNWTIRSNPFIRSFAQNQFVPIGQSAPVGGDQFYSFNSTFAPTVWGRPLVPKEVINSPDFGENAGRFQGAEDNTFTYNLVDFAPVTDFANSLLKLDEASGRQVSPLNVIKNNLSTFETQFASDPDALGLIVDTKSAVDDVQSKLTELKSEVAKKREVILKLRELTKDFTTCTDFSDVVPGTSSSLHVLAASLEDLIQLLDDKGIPANEERRQKIEAEKVLVDSLYQAGACKYSLLWEPLGNNPQVEAPGPNIECSCRGQNIDERTKQALISAQAGARQKAKETIAPARELFDLLTKELNLVAVSPLFIFDAARIRSRLSGSTVSTTRYGVGGGVRFSIVSLDVDLGYSINIHRQTRERRGAFIFSLRINDLLR